MRKIFIICFCVLFSGVAYAGDKKPNTKFYDFGEQVIDGEIRKPTVTYVDSVERAKFDRLTNLKKSFLPTLLETSEEATFKKQNTTNLPL